MLIREIYLSLIEEICNVDYKNKYYISYRNKNINLRKYYINIRYRDFI